MLLYLIIIIIFGIAFDTILWFALYPAFNAILGTTFIAGTWAEPAALFITSIITWSSIIVMIALILHVYTKSQEHPIGEYEVY